VRESAGSATLTINRAAGVGAASIDYATSDATATAGADYTATSGAVTFEFGEDTKTVSVPIADDAVPEVAEALTVTLSNAKLGSPGPTTTATVVIDDDDAPSAAPPADRLAPVVLVGATTGRLTRAFTVPYSCSEACRATFELRPARRDRRRFKLPAVIGRSRSSLPQAGKAKARIAVTRAARRRLRHVRTLVVTLRATVSDPAGNRTVESTKVRLRR
jgi:hypothetical protein